VTNESAAEELRTVFGAHRRPRRRDADRRRRPHDPALPHRPARDL